MTPTQKPGPTMSKVESNLHHWMMILLAHQEYRAIYDRIGTAAMRPTDEDGAAIQLDPFEVMEHFRASINAGIFPDIHALAWVAARFGEYLEARHKQYFSAARVPDTGLLDVALLRGGSVSLDAAFKLGSAGKKRTPAHRRAVNNARDQLCSDVWQYKRQARVTLEKAAEAVLVRYDTRPPATNREEELKRYDALQTHRETLLRYYKKWKPKAWKKASKADDQKRWKSRKK